MNYNKALLITASISLTYLILVTSFYVPYYDSSFYKIRNNAAYEAMGSETATGILKQMKEYLDNDYFGYERTSLIDKFSEKEISHLKDVKRIIDWLCILYYLSFILLIGSIIAIYHFYEKQSKELFSKILIYGGSASISFLLLIGILLRSGFNSFWNTFHQILFPQGNWMFSMNSLLMTLFPHSFFISFIKEFVIAAIVLSAISIGTGIIIKKKIK